MTIVSREHGYFPRWPEDGIDWIHPDDVDKIRGLIPSERMFQREWRDGEYATLRYGKLTIRVRPVMWCTVPAAEYNVDEEVEICSLMGQNAPGPAIVREVYWDAHLKCARYEVEQHGLRLPSAFLAKDLRPMEHLLPPPPA